MCVQIGRYFEFEISRKSFFIKVGSWERFYNMLGLPSH